MVTQHEALTGAQAPLTAVVVPRPPYLPQHFPWPLVPVGSWEPHTPFEDADGSLSQAKHAAARLAQKLIFLLCGGKRVRLTGIRPNSCQRLLNEATAGHAQIMGTVVGPPNVCAYVKGYLDRALADADFSLNFACQR